MKGEASMGALTARQEKLLALFKVAVENEKEAQETYSTMLSLSDDLAIKRIIEGFLNEERRHEAKLLAIYNDMRTTGEFKDAI
jgi:rubrerythrin